MNDGRKNVPFALSDDEDDSDVFSSIEVQRAEAAAQTPVSAPAAPERVSGPMQAVRNSGAMQAVRNSAAMQAPPTQAARAPAPRLTIETSGRPGARTAEVTAETFTIGRNDVDLQIEDTFVAPLHAMIRLESGAAFLHDTGSRNGVYLRIADDLALEDWDEIAVGTQRFVFRTTWDPQREPPRPNKARTPACGGNLPGEATRLIQMYEGGQVGGVWRLNDRVTIGRQNADVCEPDDPWLSGTHAMIERREKQFFIKDARSQHGTFIRLLDSVELIDGDVFMIGRTRIKINYP